MPEERVILRPALPEDTDGLVVAQYMDVAAEGFFQILLGKRYQHIIAETFEHVNCSYSYENVVIADLGDHPAGMLCAYSSEQHKTFSDKPLRKAAGWTLPRMLIIKSMMGPMIRALDKIPGGDFYILSLATDPEYRGRGIGTMLLEAAEQRALAEGCSRLSLDVSAHNAGAIRLYKRHGMEIERQWPKSMSIPKVTFFRMSKALVSG